METISQETQKQSEPSRQRSVALMQVSVSAVVFSFNAGQLQLLVTGTSDMSGSLSLPKYSFQSGMGLGDAARLAVRRVCRVPVQEMFQIGAVSLPNESEVHAALEVGFLAATWMPNEDLALGDVEAHSSTVSPMWLGMDEIHRLDSASRELVEAGLVELRKRARFDRIVFSLLPPEFSLSELQKVFETVIGRSIDVRNFRKKMEAMNILVESPHKPRGMAHRPPRLFSFSANLYEDRLHKDPEVRFF
jgi:8-oxo-dGTP diphosphatase